MIRWITIRPIFIFVGLMYWSNSCFCQINSWNHTHYTTVDGLVSNVIHNVAQDKEGYIWIATESGLCRFDGEEFVSVLHNQKDTSSIPTDYIYHVAIIPSGKLLASTSNGLYVMNTKTMKGYTIHSRITKGWESMDDNFRNIYVNKQLERIFILTATAVLIFDFDMHPLNTIAYQFPTSYENIGLSMTNHPPLFLPNGDIIFSDNFSKEWGLFDYKTKSIVPFKKANTHPYLAMSNIINVDCFSIDSLGNIWLHEVGKDTLYCSMPYKALVAYPIKGVATKTGWTGRICFPTSDKMIWAFIEKASTILYELPYDFLLKHKGSTIAATNPSGFSASINSVFSDKTGNYWIGSINGLDLVKSNHKELEKVELPVPFNFESEWQYVTGIKPVDDDNLLITTYLEHCFLYNIKNNTVQSYLDTVGFQNAGKYVMHFIIPLDKQRNLIYGEQGFLFQNHRLYLHPKLTNRFEMLFDQYAVKRFFNDSKGNSWVSFEDYGLVRWNPSQSSLKLFKPKGDFCCDKFTSIIEDEEGNIWCLNYVQAKLWKLDAKNMEFDSTSIDLPYRWNKRLIAGERHLLYMVSSEGLVIFNTKNRSHRLINMYEKIPSNNILGLYYYKNHLFISTPNGLGIMNTIDYSIRVLNHSDGIAEGLVTKVYYHDSSNHMLYIGGKGMVYKLDLSSIFNSANPPFVTIDGFEVNGVLQNVVNDEMVFQHEENNLSFSVSSIDYYSGKNKSYYYRIILNDDTSKWINNKSKRFSFLNMSPGKYRIEIKSKNANNQWSINTASLSFDIMKPWYNRWWFYIIVTMALALGYIYFI